MYDLALLRERLKAVFPGSRIRLTPMFQYVVVQGRARNEDEIRQILEVVRSLRLAERMGTSFPIRFQGIVFASSTL